MNFHRIFLPLLISIQIFLFPALGISAGLNVNAPDDIFTITKVEGSQAVAEGTVKNLKEGDYLYFVRSPYKFQVLGIKGNQVTVALPEKHDVVEQQHLMRNMNEQGKSFMETEKRLKQALEE